MIAQVLASVLLAGAFIVFVLLITSMTTIDASALPAKEHRKFRIYGTGIALLLFSLIIGLLTYLCAS